jgi:hypothetical protein
MIQAVSNDDSEPTFNSIKLNKDINPAMKDAFEYVVQYSNAQANFEKEKDMLTITTNDYKARTVECFKRSDIHM